MVTRAILPRAVASACTVPTHRPIQRRIRRNRCNCLRTIDALYRGMLFAELSVIAKLDTMSIRLKSWQRFGMRRADDDSGASFIAAASLASGARQHRPADSHGDSGRAAAAGGHVQVERRPGPGRARSFATTRAGSSTDLTARDFEVLDGGSARPITRLPPRPGGRQHRAAVRRQRQHGRRTLPNAREAATHVLSWLDATRDEAAIFTFDTHLDEVTPFTDGPEDAARVDVDGRAVRRHVAARRDCAHRAARRRRARDGAARWSCFTDGADNASRLTPAEVSAIASAIDVPVYIFGIVPSIDNPTRRRLDGIGRASAFAGPLRGSRRRGPAATCSWRARRGSAASRRGRSSTSCGISISSRSNRAARRAGIRSWSARGTRT